MTHRKTIIGECNSVEAICSSIMYRSKLQILSLFTKEIDSTPSRLREIVLEPHAISLDEDLNEAAEQVKEGMKAKMMESSLNPELLQRYAIADREADFEKALQNGGGKVPSGGLISVKTSRNKAEKHGKQKESHKSGKKRNKDDSSSKSNKKRKS
ncbi:hypothetical protein Vadar_016082 [Vaccinium darrowii]|uniref:Uncharacterized protein n=1 Tax=Vaccinium darrowii TaxID=229202 RepID=A0ACB7XSH0_9ERIC|nr:hypothetical protein Vadar_016082 [Vaccinium darrowii]